MNKIYHKWFEIEIAHNYFPEGIINSMSLVPFQSSAQMMMKHEIRMNVQANRFSGYIGLDQNEQPKNLVDGLNTLFFKLVNNDPLFLNYTDLPLISENLNFYFSNKPSEEKLQLDKYVTESDQIQIFPPVFDIAISENTEKVSITDIEGNIIFEQQVGAAQQESVRINLLNTVDSIVHYYVNNEWVTTIFITDQALQQQCIGIVSIDMNTLPMAGGQAVGYKLNFKEREVFWEYKVAIAQENFEIISIEIRDTNGEKMNGPEIEAIASDQNALVFISNKALPFAYKIDNHPTLKLTYLNKTNQKEETLEMQLPNANPQNIKKHSSAENEDILTSTSIIYV